MNPEPSTRESVQPVPADLKQPGPLAITGVLLLLGVLLAAMYFIGYRPRQQQAEEATGDAAARAAEIPRLSVTLPKLTPGDSEVTINCDVKANKSTIILARTNGYLKRLHAEINDVVKEGQLLAEIDSPEIDAELARNRASLDQANAAEAKAAADFALAERSAKRDQTLSRGAVTAEEIDTRNTARDDAKNALAMARANVAFAEAEVQRLSVLQSFEKVVAPYAGRITFRYLDLGALVSPGSNSNAELFTMAEIETARVIIHAPQSYATDIDPSGKPVLTLRNYPGREFNGTIAGNAGQFDPATRTMLFLLLFPNVDGALYPGMYGQVRLALSSRRLVLQIPTSAIISGPEGTKVMVVREGIVHLRDISVGRDFGSNIEVLTGLDKDEQVAINPQVQITEGTRVTTHLREDDAAHAASTAGEVNDSVPTSQCVQPGTRALAGDRIATCDARQRQSGSYVHTMKPAAQFPDEQSEGEFVRQEDEFRERVSSDGATPFPAVAGRYHLYVSLACPWAHRTLIVRLLNGLEDAIGMTVVDPLRDERGWAFREGPGSSRDPINGFKFLREAYQATKPGIRGRVTVPVLWDRETRRIVNNSEDDICRMFDGAFRNVASHPVELFPAGIEAEHAALSQFIYERVNNGVYRAGFADTQPAYESACRMVFAALDELDARLATRRFLVGRNIVEADWRLFSTLVRFDSVYHGHFKCNIRRIADYTNLQGYLMDLYQQPGIAATVNFDHIKRHYYMTHDDINPTRIVPLGPGLELTQPHGRERM